jgi:D-alanine-D-alanine ligase
LQFSGSSKYIIKPDLEHASFAIDDTAIVDVASDAELCQLIRERELRSGRPYFAEQLIDGREFNISIMGDPPHVLPPAEIDFAAFPAGKPRIVSRDAKWNETSFEYHNTPRRFEFPPSDRNLIDQLTKLTLDCWRLFHLTGYARVDFRIDPQGQPWILEINTNPCISPDAGFAAALARAGFEYEAGLQEILNCAVSRRASKVDAPNNGRPSCERNPAPVHARRATHA